jgi:hypothetical protein
LRRVPRDVPEASPPGLEADHHRGRGAKTPLDDQQLLQNVFITLQMVRHWP